MQYIQRLRQMSTVGCVLSEFSASQLYAYTLGLLCQRWGNHADDGASCLKASETTLKNMGK